MAVPHCGFSVDRTLRIQELCLTPFQAAVYPRSRPRAPGPSKSCCSTKLVDREQGREAMSRHQHPLAKASSNWQGPLQLWRAAAPLCSRGKAQSRPCGSVRWIADKLASPWRLISWSKQPLPQPCGIARRLKDAERSAGSQDLAHAQHCVAVFPHTLLRSGPAPDTDSSTPRQLNDSYRAVPTLSRGRLVANERAVTPTVL